MAYCAVASLTARLNTLTYFGYVTSMHLQRAFKMHPAPSSLAGTGGTCWCCACDMLAMAGRRYRRFIFGHTRPQRDDLFLYSVFICDCLYV